MRDGAESGVHLTRPEPPSATLADRLEHALRERVRGEVRFDAGSRGMYSTDASNYRLVPIGVVMPLDAEDVEAAVAVCRAFDVPIVARGGGTSLAGQCCNVAVVLDFSRHMNRILEIDPERRVARVQPGVILDHLRAEARKHGLTFGPDPATHNRCTLGGMLGNNSCGAHAQMSGCVVWNTESLDILTYEGLRLRVGQTSDEEYRRILDEGGPRADIYRKLRELRDGYGDVIRSHLPDIPRHVSGYLLDHLLPEQGFHVARSLVGSECTCVTILEATLRLVPEPGARVLVVLGYPDEGAAADAVPGIVERARPIALEGFDNILVDYMRRKHLHEGKLGFLPEGRAWLIAELGGDSPEEAERQARDLMEDLRAGEAPPTARLLIDPEEQESVWAVRESGLGATARVPGLPDNWPGWEDSAVPPDKLGRYLRDLRRLMEQYGYRASLYGHFGQGCVHARIPFELKTAEGVNAYRSFVMEAARLVHAYGGSPSGEHGDGQARSEMLGIAFGEDGLRVLRAFKAVWDPRNRMNPGRVVDPYPMDRDLVLGPDYDPWEPETHFAFKSDEGRMSRAAMRCVGVGLCRREEGGTMCPSYQVTREEKHTTRGRARLLYEMMQRDVVTEGWRSKEVKEALDLCLACKGCLGDCPVHVDMANYKAEFNAHYYKGRLRPRAAYAMGFIDKWALLGSLAPKAANFVMQTPPFSRVAKAVAGIAQEREMPQLAGKTFRQWYAERGPKVLDGERVVLWPDTFNNHFDPDIAQAAVQVLEAAGCTVVVPREHVCCGRPLYDYGFLDVAKGYLERTLRALRDEIRAGTPLVGLEPSCTAVFRHEMRDLLPDDEDARRLEKQTYTLAEYLATRNDLDFPRLDRSALVHVHCHHKAVMQDGAEREVLSSLGLEYRVLDSGCCGLAGSFGFEEDHYKLSMDVGEHMLFPKLRAHPDAMVVTDGFSCRKQIHQGLGRGSAHMSQLILQALEAGGRAHPRGLLQPGLRGAVRSAESAHPAGRR